jgi:hypothetical protein
MGASAERHEWPPGDEYQQREALRNPTGYGVVSRFYTAAEWQNQLEHWESTL